MKFNEKQPQLPPQSSQLPVGPAQNEAIPAKQVIPGRPATEDSEDDPIQTEGYLPEIYFSLKSENPADW